MSPTVHSSMDEKIINQHLNVCTMYVLCNTLAGCLSEYNSIFAGCVIWNVVNCTLYKLSCLGKRKRRIAKNFAWATAFFCTVKVRLSFLY